MQRPHDGSENPGGHVDIAPCPRSPMSKWISFPYPTVLGCRTVAARVVVFHMRRHTCTLPYDPRTQPEARTCSTTLSNPAGSSIARLLNIFRFSVMLASLSPAMNRL